MKIPSRTVLLALPLLLGAKTDPLAPIPEPDHTALAQGIQRYAKDEIKQNWADLYQITIQDFAMKRDLGVKDDAPDVSQSRFDEGMKNAIEGGGTPVLQSFQLTSVTPSKDGYEIRACAKGQRESFHYKGIIQLHAVVSAGIAKFGSWSYVFYSPQSCSQKQGSPM
jgi:hypothetical protein